MSMKDCKREYRVDWIEYGNLFSRWYYKEAVNSLHMDVEAPAVDEYRKGTPNIVCDSCDPDKCRNYGDRWTFF